MPDEDLFSGMLDRWRTEVAAISARLNEQRILREAAPTSRVPLLGPLIVATRHFWNRLSTRWYVRPIMDQQNRFNEEVVRALDRLAALVVEMGEQLQALANRFPGGSPPAQEDGENSLAEGWCAGTDAAALRERENVGVPALVEHRDEMEALADEKLDEEVALNYPLDRRTRLEGWSYLFDIAIAGEILGARLGDLILDLAAGTCWAGEFFNRLGVRTISLDLSTKTLWRGRKRLAADRRLEERATLAWFVVGSALHLPFADESLDGVICMNALHHMPSYGEVLREVYRVLKDGGRAVFSEPGAGHAQHPISQTRMREHGVLEKSVSLPLVHLLAREAGFSRMRIVPLRKALCYLSEYTAAPSDLGPLRRLWEDTLRLYPLEQTRFVLEKGAERPPDSLMSPQALVGRLRAEIGVAPSPEHVSPGETFVERVTVTNTGDAIWRARGHGQVGQVLCGVKICTEDGRVLRDDLRRPFPHDVAPGQTVQLEVRVEAPKEAGRYLLKYDVLIEGVVWFEWVGSPVARRMLQVDET